MFRSRPPINQETFYTSDMIGFTRIQLDELTSPQAKNLMQGLLRKLNTSGQKDFSEVDPAALSKIFNTIFHPHHFLYLYQAQGAPSPEFLLVVDIKRFWWFLNSLLKDMKGADWEEFAPPSNIKARCLQLKNIQPSRYLAMSGDALLVSDSRARLEQALLLLDSQMSPATLSSKSQSLLPPRDQKGLVNGFILWDEQWTMGLYRSSRQNYPGLKDYIEQIFTVLQQAKIEGIRFNAELVSGDKLHIRLDVHCALQAHARTMARAMNELLEKESFRSDFQFRVSAQERIVSVHLTFGELAEKLNQTLAP